MIVFGTLVASEEKYARSARPGIMKSVEPDSRVIVQSGARSAAAGYNAIIDQVSHLDELEALVLLHDDTEIRQPGFCSKVRDRLADRSIGLLGAIGAQNVTHLAYWHSDVRGVVEEARGAVGGGGGSHDVDAIDGLIMVLSPWAVRNVRFDEANFDAFHGYDIDYSFAVRRQGRRVVIDELDVYHHTKGGYGDLSSYLRASRAWRRKWLSGAPVGVRLAGWRMDGHLWWRFGIRRRPWLQALVRAFGLKRA